MLLEPLLVYESVEGDLVELGSRLVVILIIVVAKSWEHWHMSEVLVKQVCQKTVRRFQLGVPLLLLDWFETLVVIERDTVADQISRHQDKV